MATRNRGAAISLPELASGTRWTHLLPLIRSNQTQVCLMVLLSDGSVPLRSPTVVSIPPLQMRLLPSTVLLYLITILLGFSLLLRMMTKKRTTEHLRVPP